MKQLPAIAQTFILTGFSLSALSLFAISPAQAAYFSGLGWLSNASSSSASGISADGSVVVGSSKNATNGYDEAFRWTQETGMVGLGFLPDNGDSSATSVSADGAVIVGRSGLEAFRWTQGTGIVGLGFLADNRDSSATRVSADGSVVVGGSGREAFRWTQENGMVGLGFLSLNQPSPFSYATGLSANGSVVVGVGTGSIPLNNPFNRESFRWTQEDGKVLLVTHDPDDSGQGSSANNVSEDGSVIIGSFPYSNYLGSRSVAFRWTNSTGMVSLGFLPSPFNTGLITSSLSDATALSADGSIVFGYSDSSLFRWTESTGMVDLKSILISSGINLSGWRLGSISGASADGFTIVGNGTNPSGQSEAWVANLSPEPIPEPLTILGSMAAIAFAAGFERKFNKNKSDEKDTVA
jgi:probable HAF family extracellular repeat protein